MKKTKQGVRDLNPPRNARRDNRSKHEACSNNSSHSMYRHYMKCPLCGFYDNWPDADYDRLLW